MSAALEEPVALAIATPSYNYDVTVNYSELSASEQRYITDVSVDAIKMVEKSEKAVYYKDIAQAIKSDLDTNRGGMWNVIIGKSFGSFVSHENKCITHFNVGNNAFLIWKYG